MEGSGAYRVFDAQAFHGLAAHYGKAHRFLAEAHRYGFEQSHVVRQELLVVQRELRCTELGLNEPIDMILGQQHVE